MLLNHQQRKILELLCKTEHVTASELAGQLGIGVKTVRVRIKELNPEERNPDFIKVQVWILFGSKTAGRYRRTAESEGE